MKNVLLTKKADNIAGREKIVKGEINKMIVKPICVH